ncbi:MAG TPA: MFS transporter [Saprospiraceae bacterium]|nr:MFS transporter [Saprospiraceae bacterium]
MSKPSQQKASLLTIFITVFIDMLGVGIIIPVIPALFFEESTAILDPSYTEAQRSILYGFIIASYPILQFFGAPLLGALSDRYGRKPMLTMSLFGTMIGYLLFAWAIKEGWLVLLFLSRMLPGFTGGNISIILSSIADVSDAQSKTRNFGLVGTAFGLGFILGPTLGGVLADNTVVSWFGPETPFYFTAIITLLNILLVWYRFRETLQKASQVPFSLFRGFKNIAKSFAAPNLRGIFTVVLGLSLGFTFFTQFYAVILIQDFDYTEKNIGLLFGWIGIWLAITQGLIVRKLSNIVAPKFILQFTILTLSIGIALVLLPDQAWWFYVIAPVIAISQGITSPNMTSVISEQANADQQGEILGINQSMQSLGQAIPPIIAGYLNAIDNRLPMVAAAGIIFIAWVIYMILFGGRKNKIG